MCPRNPLHLISCACFCRKGNSNEYCHNSSQTKCLMFLYHAREFMLFYSIILPKLSFLIFILSKRYWNIFHRGEWALVHDKWSWRHHLHWSSFTPVKALSRQSFWKRELCKGFSHAVLGQLKTLSSLKPFC